MAVFMNELLKMSMRGIVIILIVMAFRFLLMRLYVGHKYIVGLWMMVFLLFVIPWKVSLPVGFWGNTAVLEGNLLALDSAAYINSTGNMDVDGYADNMYHNGSPGTAGGSAAQTSGMTEAVPVMPADPENRDEVMPGGERNGDPVTGKVMDILAVLWLGGLCAFVGYMVYSCLRLKKKLMLSIPYKENIRWAENIDMPMVFGLVRPRVYLPMGREDENLSYVIAHEKMHIRRKDGLLKMAAYVICLVHWFNPFIWAAYLLLGSDLEKACDEEVIRSMEKERRKEYACVLIQIASGNGKRKRKVFAAPVEFGEGNLKSRVKNVMKYKYTLPGLGIAVIVVIVALFILFLTETKEPA